MNKMRLRVTSVDRCARDFPDTIYVLIIFDDLVRIFRKPLKWRGV